jgi:hypothetical protein
MACIGANPKHAIQNRISVQRHQLSFGAAGSMRQRSAGVDAPVDPLFEFAGEDARPHTGT